MSLQARLRHPLGERWLELPERGVDQPLVVGRASSADVQVPSVTVGPNHCVLFVHDGRWVVQDVAAGSTGVYVNGSKVEGATFLHVGDLLTLGTDAAAPSIEIDPTGVAEGRSGQPAAASAFAAAPVRPAVPEAPPAYTPQPPPPGAYPMGYPVYPGTYPVPTAAAPAAWPQALPQALPQTLPAAQVPDGSIPDWPADATPRYYTPRRRRTSDGGGGVILGMVLAVLITAGAGYFVYRRFNRPAPVAQTPGNPTQTPPIVLPMPSRDDDTSAPPSIFAPPAPAPGSTRPTRQTPSKRTAPPPPTPAPGATAAGPGMTSDPGMQSDPGTPSDLTLQSDPDAAAAQAPTDPADSADPAQTATPGAGGPSTDPAWKQVEMALHLKDEARAILQFDDYARTHPGGPADKVQAYTEKMLDRIWFERIENLCEQREELNKKIAEVDKELAEETNEAHKKRVLAPLRQQYVTRLSNIDEELTKNMKYEGKSAPNLLDDAEIDKLRQSRDAAYYASWKNRVLAHIRRTHGELPWVVTKSR